MKRVDFPYWTKSVCMHRGVNELYIYIDIYAIAERHIRVEEYKYVTRVHNISRNICVVAGSPELWHGRNESK